MSVEEITVNDWRSKPRNGKAEFMKHLAFIQAGIASGETHAAIYGHLKTSDGLALSPSQFNRYINKLVMPQAQAKALDAPTAKVPTSNSSVSSGDSPVGPNTHPKSEALTPADLRRIREEPIDMKALSKRVQRS
jgi:hypothetical protein